MADPASHDTESQLNGRQHETVQRSPSYNQGDSQVAQPHNQLSTFPWTDEPTQPDTIKLQPPPPTARPTRPNRRNFGMNLGLFGYSWSAAEEATFCARKRGYQIQERTTTGATAQASIPGLNIGLHFEHTTHNQIEWNRKSRYIVVGIIGNEDRSIPRETLLPVIEFEELFKQIRQAEKTLRSPFRRVLSLKRVGGFGMYRCHPSQDYHSHPGVSDETARCLVELYRNYRSQKRDYQDRWIDWIHENFNDDSLVLEDGKYALQLHLRWSPIRLFLWSAIPIVFSLVIGLWFTIHPNLGADHVAMVQTAWTVASYVVMTTALVLAVVASVTQFGEI